jgi:NitT/TauT family transport system substrate-binding protein
VPLLAQGNLDTGAGSINASLINGIAQGANLKIVASREYFQPGAKDGVLMARKDLFQSGDLNTVAKMKSRQIAIPCLACINDFELAKMLDKEGIKAADVKVVRMNNEDMIPALQNKAVDAVLVGDPFYDQFAPMGLAVAVESINSSLPNFQYGVIVFGPNLLEKNPDLGKKFMAAYFKGVNKFMEGKTPYNAAIVKKYLKLDDKAIEALTWNPVSRDGHVNLDDISVFQDWAFSRNYIDKKVPVKDMVDTRFIN